MLLAKRGNYEQTVGYADTRTPVAVPTAIVSTVHPPRGGLARDRRRGGAGGAPAQPSGTEPGHAAPLVHALGCAGRGAPRPGRAAATLGADGRRGAAYRVAGCRVVGSDPRCCWRATLPAIVHVPGNGRCRLGRCRWRASSASTGAFCSSFRWRYRRPNHANPC